MSEASKGAFSAPNEGGRRRALERALVRIRWFGVGFGLFQVWQDSMSPETPTYVIPLAFALVGLLAAGNVALWRISRGASARALGRIGIMGFALDAAVVLGFSWLYSYDATSTTWALEYVLPLEAALRWGLGGAITTIGIAAASELAREVYVASSFPEATFVVGAVTFRVGVLAIVALVAGYMARSLQRRATAAEEQARTFERVAEQEREVIERLQALDEMRDLFLQAVSHELRTPLTAVLGYALTLEQVKLSPEETKEGLAKLASSARKLDGLLRDLLDVDRLGRGTVGINARPTDVATLVRRIALEADHGRHRVELALEPLVAELDGPKIERIVDNLIANSLKHTHQDSRIWVRAAATPLGLLLTVEDDGSGVRDDLKTLIFEPFRQGDTREHAPGTGIGLSLVARFAELHGGRAWVEDRQGGGSSFKVLLPASGPVPVDSLRDQIAIVTAVPEPIS